MAGQADELHLWTFFFFSVFLFWLKLILKFAWDKLLQVLLAAAPAGVMKGLSVQGDTGGTLCSEEPEGLASLVARRSVVIALRWCVQDDYIHSFSDNYLQLTHDLSRLQEELALIDSSIESSQELLKP